MQTLTGILVCIVMLSFLVVIHEAAHALAAHLCGMRVTELFMGLPFGPSASVRSPRTGIRYGITLALLGGYTSIAGMAYRHDDRLPLVLAIVNARGSLTVGELARVLGCDEDEAGLLLDTLADLGSIEVVAEKGRRVRAGEATDFRTVARDAAGLTVYDRGNRVASKVQGGNEAGQPYQGDVAPEDLLAQDVSRTYAGKGVVKRAIVLVAGIASNLLFAIIVVALYLMVHGVEYNGVTYLLDLPQAVEASLLYAGATAQAVAQLLVPTHTAEILQESAGVVGIVAITGEAAASGVWDVISLAAALSLSLGWMNLLPVPPLDGGKLLIEIIQAVIRRPLSLRVQAVISTVGMSLLLLLFVVMLGLDLTRVASGFYS